MKLKLIALGVLLLALLLAALYLRYGGVTHACIYDAVVGESETIQARLEDRYQALDRKLDRIESKLDRLLQIADRPLPDNLQPAKVFGQ